MLSTGAGDPCGYHEPFHPRVDGVHQGPEYLATEIHAPAGPLDELLPAEPNVGTGGQLAEAGRRF